MPMFVLRFPIKIVCNLQLFLNLLPSAHEPFVFDHTSTSFAAQPRQNYKLGCDEYLDRIVGVFQSNKV